MRPHRGVLILVFAILAFVVCPLFGTAAWLMANTDLEEMRAGRMDPEGETMTTVGRILGIIATILLVLEIVVGCLVAILFFGALAAS